MSGFIKIKQGSVEIKHFSTSSLIRLTIKHEQENHEKGDIEEAITVVWLDYEQFSNLKKAVNLTDDWL